MSNVSENVVYINLLVAVKDYKPSKFRAQFFLPRKDGTKEKIVVVKQSFNEMYSEVSELIFNRYAVVLNDDAPQVEMKFSMEVFEFEF